MVIKRKSRKNKQDKKVQRKKIKVNSVRPVIEKAVTDGVNSGEEESLNWLSDQLMKLSIMSGKNQLGVDLAIVPVKREEFDHLEARSSRNILGALNFIGPSKKEGFAFWRVPQAYNKKEVQALSKIISSTVNGASEMDDEEMNDQQMEELMAQSNALIDSAHIEILQPADEREEDEQQEKPMTPKRNARRGIKRVIEDDSDSDELDLGQLRSAKKRKVAIIEDDDD